MKKNKVTNHKKWAAKLSDDELFGYLRGIDWEKESKRNAAIEELIKRFKETDALYEEVCEDLYAMESGRY